jgi:hypothetical protein
VIAVQLLLLLVRDSKYFSCGPGSSCFKNYFTWRVHFLFAYWIFNYIVTIIIMKAEQLHLTFKHAKTRDRDCARDRKFPMATV